MSYESPIELIYHETFPKLIKQQEELIMHGCLDIGVYVDKEELIKALKYDRRQYEKGFADGRPKKGNWIPIERGEKGYSAGDFRCSVCGSPNKCYCLTPYCCSCGSRMEEQE